ncbi:MAG: thioesterase family protein [Allgaiera sp.]|jgi:4-hydroxybenzoyl-CoA thioesterase|nr:thioesterase family protein [Allgaiera sp.]
MSKDLDCGAPDAPVRAYEHEIRVTWGDCDPARIAYTARLPWFALDAINAWWEDHIGAGWYQMEIDHNLGTPFVSMRMDFRSPVTPRHRLMCEVWPNRLGETSVGFHVAGRQDGKLCFEGDFVCVFIVADAFRKQKPPKAFRDIVEAHLRPSA